MSTKGTDNDVQLGALKNESARQRWELFHRAIAHAKQSNNNALQDSDSTPSDAKSAGPILSIAR